MNAKDLRELCELAINTYLYFDTEYDGDNEQSTQAALESIDFTLIAQPHDALVGALQQAQEDTCSMHCPSVKKTGTPWAHSAKCTAISAVLKLAKGE